MNGDRDRDSTCSRGAADSACLGAMWPGNRSSAVINRQLSAYDSTVAPQSIASVQVSDELAASLQATSLAATRKAAVRGYAFRRLALRAPHYSRPSRPAVEPLQRNSSRNSGSKPSTARAILVPARAGASDLLSAKSSLGRLQPQSKFHVSCERSTPLTLASEHPMRELPPRLTGSQLADAMVRADWHRASLLMPDTCRAPSQKVGQGQPAAGTKEPIYAPLVPYIAPAVTLR